MIYNKAARENFKIYSLYKENYFWDFVQTSPKYGIKESIKILRLIDINSIIYNFYKQLLDGPNRYIVYIDNFFIGIDLYNILKNIDISAIKIIKAGFFLAVLLALARLSKK